jgi:hypothetical protein
MIRARHHPRVASVTIRRLVLAEERGGPALGEAIAAALSREFAGGGPPPAPEPAIAQAIARDVARHPALTLAADSAASRPKP